MYASKPARHSRNGGRHGIDGHLDNLVATLMTITTGLLPPCPPDPTIASNHLVGGGTGGKWVNINYNTLFWWDKNGIIRPLVHGGTGIFDGISTFVKTTCTSNPLVHCQGAMGTLTPVLNGMLNGKIMGTVYAGAISGIVGATIGGLGGAVTNA
jgi:hypothetical protein